MKTLSVSVSLALTALFTIGGCAASTEPGDEPDTSTGEAAYTQACATDRSIIAFTCDVVGTNGWKGQIRASKRTIKQNATTSRVCKQAGQVQNSVLLTANLNTPSDHVSGFFSSNESLSPFDLEKIASQPVAVTLKSSDAGLAEDAGGVRFVMQNGAIHAIGTLHAHTTIVLNEKTHSRTFDVTENFSCQITDR